MERQFLPYPIPVRRSFGARVGWYYYPTKELAERCAESAASNALIAQGKGYDFGFCSPGSIVKIADDSKSEFAGLYEVCIP